VKGEVALLGGSFNPPHVSHLMAAYWTLATQGVSEVWLLPSWKHPFGKQLAPFEDRVKMCELAAAALRGVHVCPVEAELKDDPNVGRTARTLEHLKEKHPDRRFALVLGSDVLPETGKWYRFDRVKELARIVVVRRQGYPVPVQPERAAERRVEGPDLPQVSSSAIRERLADGRDVAGLVPARVLEYIRERKLYHP
jgi:nicotinate-nucleotide adenylyltransferase